MTETKIIAIMGVTGLQGGAVVKAFESLKNSSPAAAGVLSFSPIRCCFAGVEEQEEFVLRGISRNPSSEKAKAIKPFLDEIVQADANDKESMVKAFEGCYGAFIVTNFWEDCDPKHEIEITRTLKEASKNAGLKHVVLSTLEDTRTYVNKAENKGDWKVLSAEHGMYVPHFDGKGEAAEEFASEVPTTKLLTSFYFENFINFPGMGPSRQSENEPYGITMPMGDSKLAMVSVKDIGKMVCACFQDSSTIGKTKGVMGDAKTCKEIAATFAKVCDFEVQYNAVPVEVYASFPFPGAADLANMFRFKVEFEQEFHSARTIDDGLAKKMGETVKLIDWIEENKASFNMKDQELSSPQ